MITINVIVKYIICTLFIWMKVVVSMSPSKNTFFYTEDSIGEIADLIAAKGYLPHEKELVSAAPLIKNRDNDATYLLSKLSDEELLKLLNEQPQRNEYSLNDIMKLALDKKSGLEHRLQQQKTSDNSRDSSTEKKRFRTITNNESNALFRLNHKSVDPYKGQTDPSYIALQKLKKLLNVYPQHKPEDNDESDDKKQLIFEVLVAQLKSLCCKNPKKKDSNKGQYETFANDILPSLLKQKINNGNTLPKPVDFSNVYNEFMFLIINDEVKSSVNDDLIDVDPESLDGNSSVLLLGPVTSPLNDDQLKLVMSRISNELRKPEYLSLLQQLSDGVLSDSNKYLMKNFVFGHNTRRYIKPHRCNHQSKLAKVYGGPKWIICTGYLNINKPSLYD